MTIQAKKDGRRARTEEGRHKVGLALISLIRELGRLPDVATIALRAGVGRRTVFRYFDGVGALELETARVMRQQITTQHPLPTPEGSLTARLSALLDHRAKLYEWITPIRLILDAARTHGNPALDAFIQGARRTLRANLRLMLSRELRALPQRLLALEIATSWETWRALRRGHRCSVARAKREVALMVRALLRAPRR